MARKVVKRKTSGRPPMVAKAGVKGTRYSCGGRKMKCGGKKRSRK